MPLDQPTSLKKKQTEYSKNPPITSLLPVATNKMAVSLSQKKSVFDKDLQMDKENSELLKEEESLNDSVLNSDRRVINNINNDIFKQRLREFMNKS